MAQTITQTIATKKAKRHANSSIRTNDNVRNVNPWWEQNGNNNWQTAPTVAAELDICNNKSFDKNNQNKLNRLLL